VSIEEIGNMYKILVGEPEGKSPLIRPVHRWDNNSKMYHREIMLKGVNWIQGCAANLLTGGLHQQPILSFSFWAFGSRDRQEVLIYGCMCIDILILVCHLHNLIFSALITKESHN
jgi:hypothetical protein